jgi:hypothetical protein
VYKLYALSAPTTVKKSATISSDLGPASAIRNDAQHTGSDAKANLKSMATSSSPLGTIGIQVPTSSHALVPITSIATSLLTPNMSVHQKKLMDEVVREEP